MPGDVLNLVDVETFSLEISLPDGPRQRQITDDWVACIFGPLQGISSQDVKLPDVNKLLTCLVHYCFHGIVSLDGQTYTDYKPLREAVRLIIVRSHLAPLMLARAETLTNMTEGADAAAFIAQQEQKTEQQLSEQSMLIGESGAEFCLHRKHIRDLLENQSWVFRLVTL